MASLPPAQERRACHSYL